VMVDTSHASSGMRAFTGCDAVGLGEVSIRVQQNRQSSGEPQHV
jgi:hypothetical protein